MRDQSHKMRISGQEDRWDLVRAVSKSINLYPQSIYIEHILWGPQCQIFLPAEHLSPHRLHLRPHDDRSHGHFHWQLCCSSEPRSADGIRSTCNPATPPMSAGARYPDDHPRCSWTGSTASLNGILASRNPSSLPEHCTFLIGS